jgi:RHS repeat-associated protein
VGYTYDAVSNRLSKNDSTAGLTTYTYNANDWLLAEVNGTQTTAYTYDANGNNQTKTEAGNLTTYSWNADNRIVGIDTNNHTISYEYDRAGMRTAQTVDGVRTEYSSTGTPITTYTYGGELISERRGSDESFFLMDGHSGVRVLTDKLGNLTDTSSYDAYGNVTNPLSSEFGYRGESSDNLTRLQYLRARYYQPSTGRFLGVDPFEGDVSNPVSRHRYLYGNANPVSYSDPSGKMSIGEVSLTIAVIGILSTYSQLSAINSFNQYGSEYLKWEGNSYSWGLGGELIGLPSFLGASLNEFVLKSENYSNKITHGLWIGMGVGFTYSPVPIPASFSASLGVSVKSPYILGDDPWVLGGLLNTFSATAALPFLGTSYTWLAMGFGYGTVTSPYPWDNFAVGFDISIGGYTGLSIPVHSYQTQAY